jgi:hypothetical protein
VKPVEEVSPYLQRPLRTLEEAQQDRQCRLTKLADALTKIADDKAKRARWPAALHPALAAVDAVFGRRQAIGPEHADEKVEVLGPADHVHAAGGEG